MPAGKSTLSSERSRIVSFLRQSDPSWYWLAAFVGVVTVGAAALGFAGTCWGVLAATPVAAANHLWILHAARQAAHLSGAAGINKILVSSLGRMGVGMLTLLVAATWESAEVLVGVLLALLGDLVVGSRDWARIGRKA
ncbi:MAG: hypothetical protein IMX01_03735 [Limnochordaceae bacterium]|nr:hypothetical protein [Limnochordaceae bacterium]